MDSSRLSACLLLCMFLLSSVQTLACGTCPPSKPPKVPKRPKVPPVIGKPPIVLPPVIGKPPITLPPVLPPIIGKPPISLPPVPVVTPVLPPIIGKPPITLPPVPVVTPVLPPIIGKPPISLPPVPVVTPILPPVIGGTPKVPGGCPTPPAPATCPLDTLKLGSCIDILGLLPVHIGDPAVNKCCPLIQGVVGVEAALCLCTTIKMKLLNINLVFPIALELLVSCGKAPPPGFTCP